MLGIFDKNQHLLHSFETLEQAGGIEFYIQQKELLDVFEDDNSLCVFYGFLDQEIGPEFRMQVMSTKS